MSRECRKGWHSHRDSNNELVTFFDDTSATACRWYGTRAPDSADHLGDIRHNQQQRRGEENESGLANFRMFEHG